MPLQDALRTVGQDQAGSGIYLFRGIRKEPREPIRRQPQLVNWLRLATDRLGEAQNERIWAVVKAYQLGLWI